MRRAFVSSPERNNDQFAPKRALPRMQPLRYLAAAFALLALASMTNVACSASGEIDSGTNESNLTRGEGKTAYGIPEYNATAAYADGYGYSGTNFATDCAYGVPAAP